MNYFFSFKSNYVIFIYNIFIIKLLYLPKILQKFTLVGNIFSCTTSYVLKKILLTIKSTIFNANLTVKEYQ